MRLVLLHGFVDVSLPALEMREEIEDGHEEPEDYHHSRGDIHRFSGDGFPRCGPVHHPDFADVPRSDAAADEEVHYHAKERRHDIPPFRRIAD